MPLPIPNTHCPVAWLGCLPEFRAFSVSPLAPVGQHVLSLCWSHPMVATLPLCSPVFSMVEKPRDLSGNPTWRYNNRSKSNHNFQKYFLPIQTIGYMHKWSFFNIALCIPFQQVIYRRENFLSVHFSNHVNISFYQFHDFLMGPPAELFGFQQFVIAMLHGHPCAHIFVNVYDYTCRTKL